MNLEQQRLEQRKSGHQMAIFILGLILVCAAVRIAYEKGIKEGEFRQVNSQITTYPSVEETLELTPDNVLYWLGVFEVQYPEIVLKQSILECGWKYESYRAEEYQNIFGFETNQPLRFGHWLASIIYYKAWQDKYYFDGDYYEFLENYGYAKDSLYVQKLKQIRL